MIKEVIRVIELKEIPFDAYSSRNGGLVHATGRLCFFNDGSHAIEYEDSEFSYSDSCEYEYEE